MSTVPLMYSIYADLPEVNSKPVRDLFIGVRPDIAVVCNENIFVLELTVCHETNIVKSNEYKQNKYKNISSQGSTLADGKIISAHFIEVNTLGFISNLENFCDYLNI